MGAENKCLNFEKMRCACVRRTCVASTGKTEFKNTFRSKSALKSICSMAAALTFCPLVDHWFECRKNLMIIMTKDPCHDDGVRRRTHAWAIMPRLLN